MRRILATSVISSKGTTTIPKRVRDFLNLSKGDIIVFELNDNQEIIIKRGDNFE